jgi:hypothetical protein
LFSARLSMITLATMVTCLVCVVYLFWSFNYSALFGLVHPDDNHYHSFVAKRTLIFRSSNLSYVISGYQIMLHIFLHATGVFYKGTSVYAAVDRCVFTVVEAIDMVLTTGSIRMCKFTFLFARHLKFLLEKGYFYERSRKCKSEYFREKFCCYRSLGKAKVSELFIIIWKTKIQHFWKCFFI